MKGSRKGEKEAKKTGDGKIEIDNQLTPDRDDQHRPLILGSTTVDQVGRRTRPPTQPLVRFTNRRRGNDGSEASGGLPDDEDYDEYSGSGKENDEPTSGKESTTVFNQIGNEPDNFLNTV